MTIKEVMEQAKECCEQQRPARLSDKNGLDTIDCNEINRLLITSDYTGPIPDLHIFSKLKKLHISRQISLAEFEQMDLSSIEDLFIVLEKKGDFIRFNLPKLKKLSVYISDNEAEQLSVFNTFDAVIDIRGCAALEALELRHCTDYKIKSDMLPNLTKLRCVDYKQYDFEILKFTPNLTHLTVSECWINNIDFLSLVPNLLSLDLSYNEITNADKVMELSNLQSLNLCINPLDDKEKYKTLPCKTIITDKDRDFERFLSSVWTSINMAYRMVISERKPDPKRKPFLQYMYDRQTDEQIYIRTLAAYIKRNIEYHTSTKKSWRKNVLLTPEELTEYVLQEYPFLAEYFGKDNNL